MSNPVNTKVTIGAANTTISAANIQVVHGGLGQVNTVVAKPSAQPVVMTLHGRIPPVGDTFRLDQPLYPAKVIIGDNKFVHYHVIVWTQLFGQEVSDYGCVYTNGDGLRLCFNSRGSLQKFENWWRRYERIFFADGSITSSYAPLPSEGKLSGYYVEDVVGPPFGTIGGSKLVFGSSSGSANGAQTYMHAAAHDTLSTVFLPEWVMIARHSHKRVMRMPNGWLFASAKDGVMFKMARES